MKNKSVSLPYKGILLLVIGLAWLLKNLGIYQGDYFLLGLATLLMLFYILSGQRIAYLISSLLIFALCTSSLLPAYLTLPHFLKDTLLFYLLGLVFLLLFVFHTRHYQEKRARNWPLTTASVLFFLGFLMYILTANIIPPAILGRIDLFWPLALLVISLYSIVAFFAKGRS